MPTLAADTFVDVETTIERYASVIFSTGTKLTSEEVIGFAVSIAQEMVAEMKVVGHVREPGDTTSEPETTLLRECNASGAAAEAVAATFAANRSPNRTTRADDLSKTYKRKLKQLINYLKNTVVDLRSTNHLGEGDVIRRDTPSPVPPQSEIFKFDDQL